MNKTIMAMLVVAYATPAIAEECTAGGPAHTSACRHYQRAIANIKASRDACWEHGFHYEDDPAAYDRCFAREERRRH